MQILLRNFSPASSAAQLIHGVRGSQKQRGEIKEGKLREGKLREERSVRECKGVERGEE